MSGPLARLLVAASAAALCASTTAAEWNFRVSLDGDPIGEHRFDVSSSGDEREVVSEADFTVKLLGVPVYRYRHHAVESWHGDCLVQLVSSTNDDGKVSEVRAQAGENGRLEVNVNVNVGAARRLPGCTMTFAYWNPALRQQTSLLNAQTGAQERVQIRLLGESSLDVRGKTVLAQRWRISGPAAPLDVWYSAEGQWLGLDSTVAGGRKLSYRLK